MYFVTICTEGRRLLFGTVVEGEMHPSALGETIRDTWAGLSKYAAGIRMDEFVVMPNHLHGIVCIESPDDGSMGPVQPDGLPGATPPSPGEGPRASLPQVMQQFKSYTTRLYLRGLSPQDRETVRVLWQRGYHDRVIRNDRELAAIRQYIANNALQWHLDLENPDFVSASRP